jgi:hypothetical protein
MYSLKNASIALLLLLLPTLTFAAEQHKSVSFDQKAVVGGQQLKAGDYTLKWDDSQNTTSVAFQQNGKTVATAPAQVVRASNTNNATYEVNTASGQSQLRRVYLSKEQLVFGDNSQDSGSNNTPPAE